jgi:hypothetical protein
MKLGIARQHNRVGLAVVTESIGAGRLGEQGREQSVLM